jgi:hypothetical protein
MRAMNIQVRFEAPSISPATRARAAAFFWGVTESSRSRMSASAPQSLARANFVAGDEQGRAQSHVSVPQIGGLTGPRRPTVNQWKRHSQGEKERSGVHRGHVFRRNFKNIPMRVMSWTSSSRGKIASTSEALVLASPVFRNAD